MTSQLLGAFGDFTITALNIPFILIYWNIPFMLPWHGLSMLDLDRCTDQVLYNFIAAITGILRDRERAEHKLRLELESLAAVGKTVSALAHDMKTPLVAIGGFARVVQKSHGRHKSR